MNYGYCVPCCSPCTFPYAQVIMTCPPPILAPTMPHPVKPLQVPCSKPDTEPPPLLTTEERDTMRYDNFYNSYNMDWHSESPKCKDKYKTDQCTPEKRRGQTLDGSLPCCDKKPKVEDCSDKGCPTGFKPCTMKLTSPPGCDPNGIWCAVIQPCPPKPVCRRGKPLQPGDALKKRDPCS